MSPDAAPYVIAIIIVFMAFMLVVGGVATWSGGADR